MSTEKYYKLVDDYLSFINSKGQRRISAIKWGLKYIKKFIEKKELEISCNSLYQKIGWRTFIGLAFYSAIYLLITNNNNSFKKNKFIEEFSNELLEIITGVLKYSDIGFIVSLSPEIEKNSVFKYARSDEFGNIYIYPADVEIAMSDFEENLLK